MAAFAFQTDHRVVPGVCTWLDDDVRVVVAPNAGPMTFTGTNSYLLGRGEVLLIDPGPDDPAHLAAITAALGPGERIVAIAVTHSHLDHSPLALRFAVPVAAFGRHDAARTPIMAALSGLGGGEGIDHGFAPTDVLADGVVWGQGGWAVEVVHTPGHLSNHLCFTSRGRLFSGDHAMGWATTLISPPDGDLAGFIGSCARLLARAETRYFPGHGGPVDDPPALLRHLVDHRRGREAQIVAALQAGPASARALTAQLYADVDPRLHGAAERNVLAHLIALHEAGQVAPVGAFSATAVFAWQADATGR